MAIIYASAMGRQGDGRRRMVAVAAATSDKGAEAGDGLADDERVHLARALVGIQRLGVGDEAADMVFQQDAVGAEQLARPAHRLAHAHRADALGQRRVFVLHDALLLQLRQAQAQRLTQLQEQGIMKDEHASLAKGICTVRMRETVGWARELLGANGILLEHHIGRFVADAEALYSYEGTREMNALIVGKAITGFSAFV